MQGRIRLWVLAMAAVLLAGGSAWCGEAVEVAAPGGKPDLEQKTLTLNLAKGAEMKLVLIPAGTFTMGSPLNEARRDDDEGPQKQVTLTKPFYMGIYEVTQAQYNAVMGSNPSQFKDDWSHPVENVSWNDAVAFCKKLSEKTGRTVRLPTEAEWEYACRAGSRTRYSFGDDAEQLPRYAWFRKNSGSKTQPVGQKQSNAWGLFDMHGNVWEWCSDWSGSYANAVATDPTGPKGGKSRVLRGGCWYSHSQYCRSADRGGGSPGLRGGNYGFRVAVSAGVD
jgi:formylglycine-generating enzyme required for sulfatase activity